MKWTRLNSAVAYSAFDTPSGDEILFELGEDVSQKIREREYRFLVKSDTDKYHSAMGRKNITEWRELIKRAVRRGDLEKVVNEVEIADHSDQVHDKLSSILSGLGIPVPKESPAPEPAPISNGFDAELEKARAAIFGESANALTEEISVPDSVVFDFSSVAEIDSGVVASLEADGALDPLPETDGITELAPDYEEPGEDSPAEEDSDEDSLAELCAIDGEGAVPETDTLTQIDGDGVNEILEAKLRLVDEAMARGKAEEEAERLRNDLDDLRRANDALTLENSKLRAECEYLRSQTERLTQEKERIESLRRAEADRLKDEIDARVRAENREKERLAEAARIAVENRKRIEEEQAAEAKRLLDEENKRRTEEEKRREEERIMAEREREAERIRRETEMARGTLVPEAIPAPARAKDTPPEYTYTSRRVRLYFKHLVDPNITKRIHDIIKTTIEFYHKDDVYIRIKATTPEEDIVLLDFLDIPEEEAELLVNIIKALGNSNIGITKATVE